MVATLNELVALANTFCNSGQKTATIPTSATGTNAVSLAEGFPLITSTATAQGGIPPKRLDMNKILNLLSEYCYYLQNGGTFTFNSDVSTAIGGYPLGAILDYTDSDGNIYKIKSLIANNTNTPSSSNIKTPLSDSTGTYYWTKIVDNTLYTITMELTPSTSATNGGVIDFHYAGSTNDYTSRIIEDETGKINLLCSNGLKINNTLLSDIISTSSLGFPNYNAGVTISSGSGTFSSNGWLKVTYGGSSGYFVGAFKINGVDIITSPVTSQSYVAFIIVPVKSGDTYETTNSTVFYPNR